MRNETRLAIKATVNYVSQVSMALIIRGVEGGVDIGSATCVQVGDHFLLATAAHNIEDIEDDENIQLHPAGLSRRHDIGFASRSCGLRRKAPSSDVAWIELTEETVRANHVHFVTLDDLQIVPGQTREEPFLIQGYPGESVRADQAGNLDLESTAAFTMAVDAEQLPAPLEQVDFAVEYPPRDQDELPIVEAPKPHGVSGGGVWRVPRHDATVVWFPDRLWLVGINREWNKRRKVLYCTKVEEWLRLVAADFPDTQALVNDFLERRPW